jgi:hypothetical protein
MIKGVVCGVRVEDTKGRTMREAHYMDKLVDELARAFSSIGMPASPSVETRIRSRRVK